MDNARRARLVKLAWEWPSMQQMAANQAASKAAPAQNFLRNASAAGGQLADFGQRMFAPSPQQQAAQKAGTEAAFGTVTRGLGLGGVFGTNMPSAPAPSPALPHGGQAFGAREALARTPPGSPARAQAIESMRRTAESEHRPAFGDGSFAGATVEPSRVQRFANKAPISLGAAPAISAPPSELTGASTRTAPTPVSVPVPSLRSPPPGSINALAAAENPAQQAARGNKFDSLGDKPAAPPVSLVAPPPKPGYLGSEQPSIAAL